MTRALPSRPGSNGHGPDAAWPSSGGAAPLPAAAPPDRRFPVVAPPGAAGRLTGSDPPPARRTVMQITWSLVAGGAETYALTIASNLDRRRFRPLMCAMDQGGALEADVRRLGIPCTIMHRRPGIELGLMWRLYRLFRRQQVDVIHTHHFNQLFYSVPGALLAGARIIHTEHSIEVYKRRRFRIALRVLSLLCDKVTAIGTDGATCLRQQVGIPPRKLEVVRAGVNLATFGEDKLDARRALGISPADRVTAIVARLYPEKNHLLLLHSFAQVVREVPDARLLVVGDGTERQAIADAVERLGLGEHVRMLGVRRDVARILAACDLFVLCSDREGLPIAVLEAMAASRPVVATAVGDLPGVVRHGQTGYLVPPKDPAALAAALVRVLSDPSAAGRMGCAGRRLVEAHYAAGNMVARHESLYDPASGMWG